MKSIIQLIRQRNRARLERRQLLKATGKPPSGWFSRLVFKVRTQNHERLARQRVQKQLLASLAANDTAMLEALVFLLETSRQDQRARADAGEALARRLAALEDRVDAGVRLIGARLQAIEGRLLGATRGGDGTDPGVVGARPGSNGGVNGDLKHPFASQSHVERVESGESERPEKGNGSAGRA